MSEEAQLPTGWAWIVVGDATTSMKNGIYKEKQYYSEKGIPCLRMYNIEEGKLVWRDMKHMILDKREIEEYGLLPGDIVVNRVNSRELVGKACVIPPGIGTCVFESKNIRLRVEERAFSARYLSFLILKSGRHYFSRNAQQTVGMASINQDQLGRCLFHFLHGLSKIASSPRSKNSFPTSTPVSPH
jgi:type I restriction enzyme, S subunit